MWKKNCDQNYSDKYKEFCLKIHELLMSQSKFIRAYERGEGDEIYNY